MTHRLHDTVTNDAGNWFIYCVCWRDGPISLDLIEGPFLIKDRDHNLLPAFWHQHPRSYRIVSCNVATWRDFVSKNLEGLVWISFEPGTLFRLRLKYRGTTLLANVQSISDPKQELYTNIFQCKTLEDLNLDKIQYVNSEFYRCKRESWITAAG